MGAELALTCLSERAKKHVEPLTKAPETPVARWHLLGPMAAVNGVLLFGWSTAVIFEVLRMTLLVSDDGEKSGWSK